MKILNNINYNINLYIYIYIIGTGIEKDIDDPQILNFYKEAQIPACKVGYLDGNKIKEISKILTKYK